MIVEAGAFVLILSLVLAMAATGLALAGRLRLSPGLSGAATGAMVGSAGAAALAFAALIHAFVVSDFSVSNVAANSHTDKPMLYKVAAAWGSHEGSLMLWCLVMAGFGAVLALGRGLPFRLRTSATAAQGALTTLFLAFAVLTSNPFNRLDPAPVQGQRCADDQHQGRNGITDRADRDLLEAAGCEIGAPECRQRGNGDEQDFMPVRAQARLRERGGVGC